MSFKIYASGVLLDVDQKSRIALTFQFYNPLTPQFVRVSFSNQFSLPITKNNRVQFGLIDNLKSTSQVHKVRIPIRVVQGGLETIPNGYLVVREVLDRFECVLYSIDGDLYSIISGRSLNDLDYTDINGPLSSGEFALTYRTAAEIAGGDGEIFTAVAYLGANLVDNAGTIEYIDNYVYAATFQNSFVPAFFGYKQILQRIITQAGWGYNFGELVGSYPNPKFNSLAVMQAGYSGQYKNQYSKEFRESVEFSAMVDADESFVNIGPGATRALQFLNTLRPCDFYLPDPVGAARSRYVVTNADTALGYFTGTFRYRGKVNLSASTASIEIYINGVAATGAGTQALAVGDNDVDIQINPSMGTFYTGFKDGDIIEVRLRQVGANPCTVTYYVGGVFEFSCFGGGLDYIYFNQILPSINQLDFYKDFLLRFGQIPKESNKTMYFKSLKDILSAQTSVNDWSGKRDKKQQSFDIHSQDLAQRNYYQYVADDDELTNFYGSGYFDLDDETLEEETFYPSIWNNTVDTIIEGITGVAQILSQETDAAGGFSIFSRDTGNRLLLTRERYAEEPALRMQSAGVTYTDYVVACFTKIDSIDYERNLSWQKVLEEWYSTDGDIDVGFLARLKNATWVRNYYNLTALDIAKFDPHKLTFEDGVHYLFPTIKDFVPGLVTEVEMLKI